MNSVHKTATHAHTHKHAVQQLVFLSEQTGPELEMSKFSRALHIHVLRDGEL